MSQTHLKSQRVLACVLCQQRKVKCDRKFPCANCIKLEASCVPATQTRRRKRRFPERELLDRLRKYEDLLRRNDISFEPLHPEAEGGLPRDSETASGLRDEDGQGHHSVSSPANSQSHHSETTYQAKNYWSAVGLGARDADDSDSAQDVVREDLVKKMWDQRFDNDDHILFGSPSTSVDLSTFHPDPVHIFKLWQVYLDNVHPLLKVTHTPSLQGRLVEAAGNVAGIEPTLEALMFSIYAIAVMSMTDEECRAAFGLCKLDSSTKYRFGCQQALLNCGFLRTNSVECLTSLYLYLRSIQADAHPQSVSSILGIAVRIAERIGLPNESGLEQCTVLEVEMRRRLWWSFVLFDARVSELSSHKTVILNPTWNCRVPLNVNESDLRVEMKQPPKVQARSTDSSFVTVRSEIGDFTRNSPFYLEYINPALKKIARELPSGGSYDALEKLLEDEYLQYCDPENPLDFLTIWSTRGHLSKGRLMENYTKCAESSVHFTEEQRDASMQDAFRCLECDTKVMSSPLTQRFTWYMQKYFPFPAYIHITQELKKRPLGKYTETAWKLIGENCEIRFDALPSDSRTPFKFCATVVLQAWDALEATVQNSGTPLTPPKFVTAIKQTKADTIRHPQSRGLEPQSSDAMIAGFSNPSLPTPPDTFGQDLLYPIGGEQVGFLVPPGAVGYPGMQGQGSSSVDSRADWLSAAWDFDARSWGGW